MKLATFRCDVTPPIGHPLCAGWVAPAREIVDRQFAYGVVLQPDGEEPIVLCAVDFCELRGEAHDRWRDALADAVGAPPMRVAVQCIHQHDAVLPDVEADRILAADGVDARTVDPAFFEKVIGRCGDAARRAAGEMRPITHIGTGQAKVEKVASIRRIRGENGKVVLVRYSSCKQSWVRAAPEGRIDPWLKCISFWDGDQALAALHYYATHPMSYYGGGGVSADFAGLARKRCRAENRAVSHIYFTGCGGDVGAGKYNEGLPKDRPILTERMYKGMRAAFDRTKRQEIRLVEWRSTPVHLPMRDDYSREYFERMLRGENQSTKQRILGAMGVAWWDRYEAGKKIDLSCLRINNAFVLHLPGEPFVAYQLAAQKMARPEGFVAVAGYGDGGPGYLPTAEAYEQGGYEVTAANVGPNVEAVLMREMQELLQP